MTASAIAALNDAFRREPGLGWFLTEGVRARGAVFCSQAVEVVEAYCTFTESNDPHGEHDFGSFELRGEKLFWKIDYYAKNDLSRGSEDPSDQAKTARVLTIMLASEY